jgi:hypothetical protein
MLHTCPNNELSREIILQNVYARLSRNDQTMLDSSSTGSFMNTIEIKWDVLEKIKRNYEDWEIDKGNESGINLEFDCVKSFMETDFFQKFSTKYGLDSEIVASFCESFAAHVDLPKEKWFKYHPPIEIKEKTPEVKEEKVIVYNVDPVVPTTYFEKPPFPVRIKEHSKVSSVVRKSYDRTPTPSEQIKVEPSVAIV